MRKIIISYSKSPKKGQLKSMKKDVPDTPIGQINRISVTEYNQTK